MAEYKINCGMAWVSWRSIVAGAITTLAVSIVMAVLGVALGFTVLDPLSRDPFSGLGLAFGVWSFISVVLSLGAGGFVAGFFSGNKGCEHGFLVWATVLVVGTFFTSVAVGSALSTVGSIVGNGAASAASAIGEGTEELASKALDRIQRNLDREGPAKPQHGMMMSVMRDTGLDVLQPEYMRDQMRQARSELRAAVNQLSLNPGNYEKIIAGFLAKQKQRVETLPKNIDREAAITGLMRTRQMSRDDAERLLDRTLRDYNAMVSRAEEMLTEAQTSLEDAGAYLKELSAKAREDADAFASAAAKSALVAALALIFGAIVSSIAGLWGNKLGRRCFEY